MLICGVIAEYNPFHLGHAYQLGMARQLSNCDYVVAVMGGSFSQRGDPMLVDKWTRARMALAGGADLVVELPALFAVRSAEGFAVGGVRLMSALGAECLSFGCETDNLGLLQRMAEALNDEPEALKQGIRRNLEQGKSHARARGEALAEHLGADAALIGSPNAALAIEYLRANGRLDRPMAAFPVLRTAAHHDLGIAGHASASAIRNALSQGRLDEATGAMPPEAASILMACWPDGTAVPGALDALLLDKLRCMSPEQIAALPDVSEGLEMRIKKCCQLAHDRSSLIALAKCKRYTHARLNRLCAHALLGITRQQQLECPQPPYARVLGFRRDAAPLMAHIKRAARLPLVSDPVRLKGDACFALDMRATDLQGLTTARPELRRAARDLTQPIILV